jgi:hypothetical protein
MSTGQMVLEQNAWHRQNVQLVFKSLKFKFINRTLASNEAKQLKITEHFSPSSNVIGTAFFTFLLIQRAPLKGYISVRDPGLDKTCSIILYFLSFIGAQARELVLKADALLTHDHHSQLTPQLKTSKYFFTENLLYLIYLLI